MTSLFGQVFRYSGDPTESLIAVPLLNINVPQSGLDKNSKMLQENKEEFIPVLL